MSTDASNGARASLEIWQVDVFSDRPLAGNPAAVVFGADALPTGTMQAIARETNLSETVFLLAPTGDADFRARIFTTRREIPFAGHPALAAGHAWLEAAGGEARPVLVQECGIGKVGIHRRGDGMLAVSLPRPDIRPSGWNAVEAAALFGLAPDRVLSVDIPVSATGVQWVMLELAGIADLAALVPDHSAIARATRAAKAVGVTVFARHADGNGKGGSEGALARLRTFAPAEGIYEDPVCGSCHGSLAALLLARGELPRPGEGESLRIVTEQGHEISRPGTVEITVEGSSTDPTLWLGGRCVTVMRGRLFI